MTEYLKGDREGQKSSPGTLYLCATPIGNLEDITLRVLRVLKEVDLVVAEDTRRTRHLLNYYEINKPLISYHQHNELQRGKYLIQKLLKGDSLALVSDAGMPGISDPGEELVREAVVAGIPVTALPGPSVVLAALSLSGLTTRRFVFEGFLPRSKKERKKRIRELSKEERTIVIFEAPHRLLETLAFMKDIWTSRKIAIVRELSKQYEEVVRGSLEEVSEHFLIYPPCGEITMVIEGYTDLKEKVGVSDVEEDVIRANVIEIALQEVALRVNAGEKAKEVIREIAKKRELNRRNLYQIWIKEKASLLNKF